MLKRTFKHVQVAREGLYLCVYARVSLSARAYARVCARVRADDPDAAEDAGDAEGAHGADDDDGHVERAQRREGEGHHDEVEPGICACVCEGVGKDKMTE